MTTPNDLSIVNLPTIICDDYRLYGRKTFWKPKVGFFDESPSDVMPFGPTLIKSFNKSHHDPKCVWPCIDPMKPCSYYSPEGDTYKFLTEKMFDDDEITGIFRFPFDIGTNVLSSDISQHICGCRTCSFLHVFYDNIE